MDSGVPIHWTGLLDWTTGLGLLDSKFNHKISFPAQLQPPKAIVSPHLKSAHHWGIRTFNQPSNIIRDQENLKHSNERVLLLGSTCLIHTYVISLECCKGYIVHGGLDSY